MTPALRQLPQIVWPSVVTASARFLIGAEGRAAFAGGWALAILFRPRRYRRPHPAALLFALGVFIMGVSSRSPARRAFTRRA